VIGWYSVGAVPAALLGGLLFAQAPLAALTRLLGVFLLVMVVFWYFRRDRFPRLSKRGFAPLVLQRREALQLCRSFPA
jgi:uncharacterized membrane protein YfcA